MKLVKFLWLLLIIPVHLVAQTPPKLERTKSFFGISSIDQDKSIQFGYMTVPENWNAPDKKVIKVPFIVLKCKKKSAQSQRFLYIEGGPGQSGTNAFWSFYDHPLRQRGDIILMDVRGTGNAVPKLCPSLGKSFFEILAKDQTAAKDEKDRVDAAMGCEVDLIRRGIDIGQYNSSAIARDLNALKKALLYPDWSLLGVSYGTYIAQVYASAYPGDIRAMILDSPIANITTYYNNRNEDFEKSLQNVFLKCKADSSSNRIFPDLQKTYYRTIQRLSKNPLTVKVDKNLLESGYFTYNAEDFKICIQQALYSKELTALLPVIITEFYKGDIKTIGSLVGPFSGGLGLDFGAYYCVSCNEVLPYNSIQKFDSSPVNAKTNGGLSFYRTDFKICDQWNKAKTSQGLFPADLSSLKRAKFPVLILSGEFDPITPVSNGKILAEELHGKLVEFPASGHALMFSPTGAEIINEFIDSPRRVLNVNKINPANFAFVDDIIINGGVASFAGSISRLDPLFFAPLVIALFLCISAVIYFIYTFIQKKQGNGISLLFQIVTVIGSVLGVFIVIFLIVAVINTNNRNFYICAFGFPENYSYLFILQWIFLAITVISLIVFLIGIKKINDKSIAFTIIFSLSLINTYFLFWGFFN